MADTPEIPEAAITAGAEVIRRQWDELTAEYGLDSDTFRAEAREVLAAALPHLGAALDREQLHCQAYDYARTWGWNPRGANRFAANYVKQVTSGNTIANEYGMWDVQQFSRRDFDPGWR